MSLSLGCCDELGLRQKLMVMENAVNHISAIKAQLRSNAEIARKEISNAIGYQLSLVRAHEQFLLRTLESILDSKERILCEQQEHLNQAIGACQQSMENIIRGNNDNTSNARISLNVMDLRPHTNSHLLFKSDPTEMRRAIYNFGQVISDPTFKDRTDCCLMSIEDYEDGASLAHKSVHRVHRNSNAFSEYSTDSLPTPINDWLQSMNINKTDTLDTDDFEIIRNRINSESASSIEIISKSDNEKEKQQNLEILKLPIDQWLINKNNQQNATLPQKILPGLKRGTAKSDHVYEQTMKYLTQQFSQTKLEQPEEKKAKLDSTPKNFEFEKVIGNIVNSKSDEWLTSKFKNSEEVPQVTIPKIYNQEFPPVITSVSESNINKKYNDVNVGDNTYCEKMINKLKSNFPDNNSYWLNESAKCNNDRPINSISADLGSWESVLGWKSILEKLHASGEDDWLVPSSRQLKTTEHAM